MVETNDRLVHNISLVLSIEILAEDLNRIVEDVLDQPTLNLFHSDSKGSTKMSKRCSLTTTNRFLQLGQLQLPKWTVNGTVDRFLSWAVLLPIEIKLHSSCAPVIELENLIKFLHPKNKRR